MEALNLTHERKEQTFIYASFPQISDLCCTICEIDFVEVKGSTKSNFHWQTMKCRLLIYLISDVIASPVSGTEKYIFIIAHKKFFETGKLERILRNFKLVYQGLRSVTPELYKSCLKYTIQSKIAPLWNMVGEYYIRGKDFYNAVGGCEALTLDILIDERYMGLQLYAEKVRVSYIKLEDYLPSSVISEFLADPKGYIDLSRYNFPLIHVLPSTKMGKLLSVSKEIPTRSTFEDYSQLRRHWKNMYGYSLPKNADGILYYEIKFLIARSKIFTYPNLCVMRGPLDIITNKDKQATVTHFVSDMLVKLPTVCGKQLQVSKHNSFSTKCLDTNSLSDTLTKDKGLNTHLKESGNTNSQLEYYNKNGEECTKNVNTVSKPLKSQLAKIHEIHNTKFCGNIKTDSDYKNTREKPNETQCLNTVHNTAIEYSESVSNENNVTKKTSEYFTVTEDKGVCRYFKIEKPHSSINKGESLQEKKHKRLKLNEILSKTKSNENCTVSLQGMDHTNVEAMARSNQLHHVKNNVLCDWLTKHSIPHNSKEKKIELIKKVLWHIKNTEILQQCRI